MSAAAPPPPPGGGPNDNFDPSKPRCSTTGSSSSSGGSLRRAKTSSSWIDNPDEHDGPSSERWRREPLLDVTNVVLTRSARRRAVEQGNVVAGPSTSTGIGIGGGGSSNGFEPLSMHPPRTPRRHASRSLRRTQSEQTPSSVSSSSSSSSNASLASSPMTSWAGRLIRRGTGSTEGIEAGAGPRVLADDLDANLDASSSFVTRTVSTGTRLPIITRRTLESHRSGTGTLSSSSTSSSSTSSSLHPAPPRGVGLRRTRSSLPRLPSLTVARDTAPGPRRASAPMPSWVPVHGRTLSLDDDDDDGGGDCAQDVRGGGEAGSRAIGTGGRRLRRRRTEVADDGNGGSGGDGGGEGSGEAGSGGL